jgi:hypothetical protein
MRGFIPRRDSTAFAAVLASLLEEMSSRVTDPRTGIDLLAAFYETDEIIFNHCDDSNGRIGDVFRHDALDLFVHYASRCEDKPWLADLLLQLNRSDGYGVRSHLFERAGDYLPSKVMRGLVGALWELADEETNKYQRWHWLHGIESLALQLKDAPLFERARRACWPELGTAACVDIAAAYLDAGDPATALSWLERIPVSETFQEDERDELLLAAHGELGNREQQEAVAWRTFRRYRCEESFGTLLSVIGGDQRARVLDEEAQRILQSAEVCYSDAAFLVSSGRMEEAEAYLLARADQLDGYFYEALLPLAESMEEDGRFLAASIIYRALLESILGRAQSRYYRHGVRYLKKLDVLAPKVGGWQTVMPHPWYVKRLRRLHARKTSFWSRYEE